MKIAFDVDGTLISHQEYDCDTPNYEVIAIYRWFQAQGHTMIVWSGCGIDYAQMWAEKLGLSPDMVILKTRSKEKSGIDIAFDDCDVDLATVNFKVKTMKK